MRIERVYSVLFLLLKEQRKVYMDISFARDLRAVLRKHWCGEVPCTRECFSYENPQAKPEMLVWKIGYVSREVAGVFLQKWEEAFLQQGFEIIASQVNTANLKDIKVGYNSYRLKKINVDNLMRGADVQRVTCRKETKDKKEAAQKYVAEAAEDVLNIRTTWEVSHTFRAFCKERGLTQNQGLSLLVETANGMAGEMLDRDLWQRLANANDAVEKKEKTIQVLQKQLEAEKTSKQRPALVQAALLQNALLKEFFRQLPEPIFLDEYEEQCGVEQLLSAFPEKKEYRFPNKDGVYTVYLEHMKGVASGEDLSLVYGRSQNGTKYKFCYPHVRKNHYGEDLSGSPYLRKGYPWLFAIQKRTEIAYIVGALPLFDFERISDWCVEVEFGEEFPSIPKYEELFLDDRKSNAQELSLEEQIKMAEKKKQL